MIWDNFDENIPQKNSFIEEIRKAKLFAVPIDRLGAFFIDSLIAYSIASLLCAPLQKSLAEAQIIGDTGKILFYGVLVFVLNLLIFLAYQSFSMFIYKQSIGQKIFAIKVVGIWTGKPLGFFRILKRNIFLLLELPFLLPFTAIFVDPNRRIFHEKVSDSITVTDSERYATSPTPQEKSFMKGLLIPAYLWIFAISVSIFSAGAQYLLQEDSWLAELSSAIPHCEQVLNSMQTWPKNTEEHKSRLLVALSLYSAGQVSKECLLSEADAAFLKNKDLDHAYLAKAFALEGVVELSDEYLKKVCEDSDKSEACLFSKLINYWAESDWEKANLVVDALVPGGKSYVLNYAIEHYMGRKQYTKAYELIEKQSDNLNLRNFLALHRTKALWNMGKEMEAETSFIAARTSLSETTARKEQAWLCWKSLKNSCDAAGSSICKTLPHSAYIDGVLSDEEVLARVNLIECEQTKDPIDKIRSFAGKANESSRVFLNAYLENTKEAYLGALREDKINVYSSSLNYEIVDRLAKKASSVRELNFLEAYLLSNNHFASEWESSVISVVDAYYRLGANQSAQDLARQSLDRFDENQNFKRNLILTAYQKSDDGWLKSLRDNFKSSRSPASVKKGSVIRRSSNSRYFDVLKEIGK
jgi:uncharacterized RDD family membrane protein YckC